MTEGLEAFTFAIFTRLLGYSKEEVEVLCAKARKELKDPKQHAMMHLHVVYGQKPEEKSTEPEEKSTKPEEAVPGK